MDFKVTGTRKGITAFQMDIKIGEKDANLAKIESLIVKSITPESKHHSHIICLPELCTTGFDLVHYKNLAENVPEGKSTRILQKLAEKYSVYIILFK